MASPAPSSTGTCERGWRCARSGWARACWSPTATSPACAAARTRWSAWRRSCGPPRTHRQRRPRGRITHWNPGAERLLGYAADEIVGRYVGLLVRPEELPLQNERFRDALAGRPVARITTQWVRKDNTSSTCCSARPRCATARARSSACRPWCTTSPSAAGSSPSCAAPTPSSGASRPSPPTTCAPRWYARRCSRGSWPATMSPQSARPSCPSTSRRPPRTPAGSSTGSPSTPTPARRPRRPPRRPRAPGRRPAGDAAPHDRGGGRARRALRSCPP